jgi:hypothetical protein
MSTTGFLVLYSCVVVADIVPPTKLKILTTYLFTAKLDQTLLSQTKFSFVNHPDVQVI